MPVVCVGGHARAVLQGNSPAKEDLGEYKCAARRNGVRNEFHVYCETEDARVPIVPCDIDGEAGVRGQDEIYMRVRYRKQKYWICLCPARGVLLVLECVKWRINGKTC